MGRGTRGLLGALAAGLMLSGCWTQIGFGPERRRYNPFEQGITPANVDTLAPLWSVTLPGGMSEPVLAGGRVHVSRTDTTVNSHSVTALDGTTGTILWNRTLLADSPVAPVSNSVAFSGNELWGSFAAQTGAALVRLDPQTGATIASEADEVVLSPVVTGDDVLAYLQLGATFHDRVLVVRDRTTLATLWTAELTSQPSWLLISGDRIHLVSSTTVEAYPTDCGASTCAPLWRRELTDGSGINAAALGPDGEVVTTTAFRFVEDRHGMRFPEPSVLTVSDGATGITLWSARVTSLTGGMAIDDDHIYVSTREQLDDLGNPLGTYSVTAFALGGCGTPTCFTGTWSRPLPSVPGSPLVGGGVVYAGVGSDLHALATDGTPLATFLGVGTPRSLGEGRLYTTTGAADSTSLRALAPVS